MSSPLDETRGEPSSTETDAARDESDNSMFTDSFAPRPESNSEGPQKSVDEPDEPDDFGEIEELLPQAEPIEGPAPLP